MWAYTLASHAPHALARAPPTARSFGTLGFVFTTTTIASSSTPPQVDDNRMESTVAPGLIAGRPGGGKGSVGLAHAGVNAVAPEKTRTPTPPNRCARPHTVGERRSIDQTTEPIG